MDLLSKATVKEGGGGVRHAKGRSHFLQHQGGGSVHSFWPTGKEVSKAHPQKEKRVSPF